METRGINMRFLQITMFKIDLIVWKRIESKIVTKKNRMFKIDLIVWKHSETTTLNMS